MKTLLLLTIALSFSVQAESLFGDIKLTDDQLHIQGKGLFAGQSEMYTEKTLATNSFGGTGYNVEDRANMICRYLGHETAISFETIPSKTDTLIAIQQTNMHGTRYKMIQVDGKVNTYEMIGNRSGRAVYSKTYYPHQFTEIVCLKKK